MSERERLVGEGLYGGKVRGIDANLLPDAAAAESPKELVKLIPARLL